MEYISFVWASRPRFKTQSYPTYSPALPVAEFNISNAGPQRLATDKVQFGVINRAQKSKAAKRENINREKDKKREAIRSIEENITSLYDQNLPTQDRKAFQIKVIELLEAHPELSMNISLRFDLKNRKLPAIPLLHFALAQQYFALAEYVLQRDAKKDEIDYTQTDFRGKTAAQIAQLVFEDSQENDSDDQDENSEVCKEYVDRIMLKSYKYEQLHPEKRTNTLPNMDEEAPTSSPLLLKNFSHRSWKEFLKEELGREDVSSDEDSPADSKATGSQVSGSTDNTNSNPTPLPTSTVKEKKPKLSRRQQVEQAEKKKRQDEIDRKNKEQAAQSTKLEAAAALSSERQKLEEKRMAAINKAWDLNARLEAIPKMQLALEWKPEVSSQVIKDENPQEAKNAERKDSVLSDGPAEPPKPIPQSVVQQAPQPDKADAFKIADLRPASVFPNKKIVPAVPNIRPGRSVTNKHASVSTASNKPLQTLPEEKESPDKKHTMSNESTGKGIFASPTPLTPVADDEELISSTLNQFSLNENDRKSEKEHRKASVELSPTSKGASQSSYPTNSSFPGTSRTFSQSSGTTGITQPSTAGSISSNNSSRKARSRSSKIAALKRNLEEKQQLLNQASVLSLQNQQVSFSERQKLLDKAIHDFNLARQEYLKSQKLQWEKQQVQWERDSARSETSYWQNEAQQRSMAWANYAATMQDELNALRTAFNAKRQGIFQEQMHVLTHPSMNPGYYAQQWNETMNPGFYDSQWVESLNDQEQAIQGLENLQTQIHEQESEIEKNFIPCRGGVDGNTFGYRVKNPCGKKGVWPGSWVPDR